MRSACRLRLLFLLPSILAAQPDRITTPIDTRRTVVLRGNVHRNAQPQFDQGPVEPAFRVGYITLMVKKTEAQQPALEQLLEEQQDPASPSYHDWLTPEQYADRFGLSQNDLDKISAWLQAEGFTVEYTARGRNWLAFSGTAGQVRATFRTEIHRYRVAGEFHFALSAEPSVPASLEPVVAGLLGLDDFYPKALHRPRPDYTAANGSHSLAPGDLATIYDITRLYQANIDGTGQKIVIVGQSGFNTLDIQGFRTKYNLPSLNLQTKIYGSSDPGITDDQSEADLDLEWAGAVAPNAALIYVYGHNADSAVFYAMDNNLAPVISESFGSCEAQSTFFASSYESQVQQANAQGITWLVASGDSGAAGCDDAPNTNTATQGLSVGFPASVPEVTGVGGTEFSEGSGTYWNNSNGSTGGSARSYIPEIAWNDTSASRGLLATGGGASSVYPKPVWQTGMGDGARDVPDVSLSAGVYNDPYNVLSQGGWELYGGTSASTPVLAAMVAMLNQYLVVKGVQAKAGVGNINPTLYKMAQSAPSAFHDIATGNNIVPCRQGTPNCSTGRMGYNAGAGYDLATGLGSVDAYNLVTQWSNGTGTPTTTTVTANPTSVTAGGSTVVTARVSANTVNTAPAGSVTFALGGVTLGIFNPTVSGGAATASLTVFASQLAAGDNTIAASYTPASGFLSSSGTVTVTLIVPAAGTTTTLTANPASMAASGSTTLTATVTAVNSSAVPTGSVAFKLGSTPLGAASLSGSGGAATASLTVSGSQLTVGSNSITASYGGSGAFLASSSSVTVNVTTAPAITLKLPAITNAASYALGGVSPGENVVIWGTNIGPPTLTYGTLSANGTMLGTSAGNTSVLFDGVAAPIVYALATQTSVMVPYEVAGGSTTRVVVEYQGAQSNTLTFNVVAAVPGIYTQTPQGFGPGASLNQDGLTVNGPYAPAPRGSVVSVYMTGEGQTSPAGMTGAMVPVNVPAPWKQPKLKATATVGGLPAAVQYYGSAPGAVSGIMQVNLQIPSGVSLASGPAPMAITLTDPLTGASFSTQAQVTVSVQ